VKLQVVKDNNADVQQDLRVAEECAWRVATVNNTPATHVLDALEGIVFRKARCLDMAAHLGARVQ